MQGIQQIALVEGLERTGYYRATPQVVGGELRQVVAAGQVLRQVTVVGGQRETAVDDVEMTVEEREALEPWIRHTVLLPREAAHEPV